MLKQQCRRQSIHCQAGLFPKETALSRCQQRCSVANEVVCNQIAVKSERPNGSVETFVERYPCYGSREIVRYLGPSVGLAAREEMTKGQPMQSVRRI